MTRVALSVFAPIDEWLPTENPRLVDLCRELGIPVREKIDPDLGTLRLVPSWARTIWRASSDEDEREALSLARDSAEHRAALVVLSALPTTETEVWAAVRAYLASIGELPEKDPR
jgi:hypothetical protein